MAIECSADGSRACLNGECAAAEDSELEVSRLLLLASGGERRDAKRRFDRRGELPVTVI